MNIVKLYGGLGNQMFQYAFGKNFKDIRYDISWFNKPTDPPRPFRLNRFRVSLQISPMLNQSTFHEKEYYCYMPDILQKENTNFFGYWQAFGYIENVLEEVRGEFRLLGDVLTEEYIELKESIICRETVGIHVRRGDYVLVNGHHLESIEYYKKALKKVKGQLFIFSDDIPWCRENFKDATFVDLDEYFCFDLLRLCTHKIIANSTFSLWTALLKDEGTVICPKIWRVNEKEQVNLMQSGLIRSNWKMLC